MTASKATHRAWYSVVDKLISVNFENPIYYEDFWDYSYFFCDLWYALSTKLVSCFSLYGKVYIVRKTFDHKLS